VKRLLLTVLLLCGSAFAHGPFYIDCTGGSDSNAGTSTSVPWLHHPYMAGWSGSYTHAAGDQFYFKGGVTCPGSYFPLTPANGGSSGAGQDYYGPDPSKAWFTGGSWSRPIFGFTAALASPNVAVSMGSNTYIHFDNFEITGFHDLGDNGFDHSIVFLFNGDHITLTNNYMHAWVPNLSGNDEMQLFGGCNACSGANQANTIIENNYMNGSDATPAATSDGNGSGFFAKYVDGGTIAYNVVHNVSNVIIGGANSGTLYHDNVFTGVWCSYDATDHENILEMNGAPNNIFINNVYGNTTSSCVWPMPLDPVASSTEVVANNICYSVAKDCISIDTQGTFSTYTLTIINNTLIPASGQFCADTSDRGATNTIGTLNVINNHCITTSGTSGSSWCFAGTSSCSTVTSLTETTNTLMTTSTATTQGYTNSESFVYSPTASGNSTVHAGTNESSLATGAIAALASDTTYACTVNGSNQVVCPARTTNARGSTWDAGAYQYASGGPPLPPTGLTATVSP